MSDQIRDGLEQLQRGDAQTFNIASIPAERLPEWRADIERHAADIGLDIVVRDENDPWIPISPGHLIVMRFEDYANAYGLPR